MKKISRKKRNRIIAITICFLALILCAFAVLIYFEKLDQVAKELADETKVTYTLKSKVNAEYGMYVANVKEDMQKLIKKNKNATTVTYKIKDETVYFQLSIIKDEEDIKVQIDKIVDDANNVSARMTYRNIERIEYKTGASNNATVLHIITEYDDKYLAIADNNYYFLGTDVDIISYSDEHFHYYSFNTKYSLLRNAESCYDEYVQEEIENFNTGDEYYIYGTVNFLNEFYQKLDPVIHYVNERCDELANKIAQ